MLRVCNISIGATNSTSSPIFILSPLDARRWLQERTRGKNQPSRRDIEERLSRIAEGRKRSRNPGTHGEYRRFRWTPFTWRLLRVEPLTGIDRPPWIRLNLARIAPLINGALIEPSRRVCASLRAPSSTDAPQRKSRGLWQLRSVIRVDSRRCAAR